MIYINGEDCRDEDERHGMKLELFSNVRSGASSSVTELVVFRAAQPESEDLQCVSGH